MDILIHSLWIIAGLTALYFGAEWLVKGAGDIALKLGISPLVVGLTVVAFGTSAPELLVCLQANTNNEGGIALGNVIGSNICNIALILGVGAMIKPIVVHKQVIRREMPILLLASVVFVVMMFTGGIQRWEGGLLFAGVCTYVISSFISSKKEGDQESEEFSSDDVKKAKSAGAKEIMYSVGCVLIGLVVLKFGSDWLVEHGVDLSNILGISPAIIALLLLALGTSLPELATSIVAAKKGQGDIITGNAVGSCIFNLLAVMGVTALVKPIISSEIATFDVVVMLALTVLIIPMMYTKKRLSKAEGIFLLAIYVTYCGTRYAMEVGAIPLF